MGFTVKRVLRRVLRRGSEKGVSRRCLECPLGEYVPLGVRPKKVCVPFSVPNMTGRPGCRTMEMNGGSSVSYLTRTPCVPLFPTLFNRDGDRRAFRLLGEGRDHVHCAVEPSPGQNRC